MLLSLTQAHECDEVAGQGKAGAWRFSVRGEPHFPMGVLEMRLEATWYEISPYVYLVVGLIAVLFSTSELGLISCALLLTASLITLRLRRIYRSPAKQALRKYSRPI